MEKQYLKIKYKFILFIPTPGLIHSFSTRSTFGTQVFLGETYDVSPYDSQRSHPSMDLGVKWYLCVMSVQTAVKCQDCKFV